MKHLPEELVSYIFTFIPDTGVLSVAMLVCQKWYMHGARSLHHNVILSLAPGLSIQSSDTVVSFMKRVVSPTLSTADYIHHLTLSGFASLEIQEMILDILSRTRALRSLNMHALNLLQGGMLLPPEIFSSNEFLPNLVALNATSAQFSVTLSHSRRMRAIRIHEPLDSSLLRRLASPKNQFPARIKMLELALLIDSMTAAIEGMAYLASAFADAPLDSLALQFVLDRPGPVSWTQYEYTVGEIGRILRRLQNLRSLSLVIRPDPLIPANAAGEPGTGELYRETMTKRLAEKLIYDNGLALRRIELRWHGWMVQDGQLVPLPRTQLLRLPHMWLFAESDYQRP